MPEHSRTFFAPRRISPSNGLTTPLLPNDTSESLIPGRSTYYHDMQLSIFSPENPFPYTSASIELHHRQNSTEAAFIGFAAHLEKAQVLQSLSIVQDYMAKHPWIFERQASETVQRWMVDIQSEDLSVSLPEWVIAARTPKVTTWSAWMIHNAHCYWIQNYLGQLAVDVDLWTLRYLHTVPPSMFMWWYKINWIPILAECFAGKMIYKRSH